MIETQLNYSSSHIEKFQPFIENPEQIDLLSRGVRFYFICRNCGIHTSALVQSRPNRTKQKRLLCKRCAMKQTSLEKYGVDNPAKSQLIKGKIKQTCLDKYGTEWAVQSQIIKDKIETANLEKYGVKTTLLEPNTRKKIKETMINLYGVEHALQNVSILQKAKNTCKQNYGVEHCTQSPHIIEKIKESNILKYGVEWTLQSEQVRTQIESTCLERYGVKTTLLEPVTKEKIKQTMISKYGTESYWQSNKASQNHRNRFLYGNEYFDSSWELAFYLYHVDKGISILREPQKFEYIHNDTLHYYFPDFEVNGQLYEIKGNQFFKEDGTMCNPYDHSKDELFEAKHLCAIAHNVIFISEKEIQPYLDYVNQKYGKDFLKSCKIQKVQD